MRRTGLGLAAALMLAVFAVSSVATPALAASKPAIPPISPDLRKKGMADGPAVIAAAGVDCQLADARFIGENVDAKTKAKSDFYEFACTGNVGVVVDKAPIGPQVFTCMETSEPGPDGKPNNLACILPANLDTKAGLVPYIAKAGTPCTIDKARALGHSPNNTVYEVACHEGTGYILMVSAPPRLDKPATMKPCVVYADTSNVKCELTDRTAQLSVVDRLIGQSGKPCAVKDRSFIGTAQSGDLYFEVACQDGKGYILDQAANGSLAKAIDCLNTDMCKMTDTRVAQTEQAGLYTKLARKAGFECDVNKYGPFNTNRTDHADVVELSCNNRPDGAVAIFPATGAGVIYDCAHSELEGFRCSFTKAEASFPKVTADLAKLGKTQCVVSNSRTVGVTADKRSFLEVACADGLPGYMIEFSLDPLTPKQPIPCVDAAGIAGGCRLAGNTKTAAAPKP
jgi:hypothetical protein